VSSDPIRTAATPLLEGTEALGALGAALRLRVSRSAADPAIERALADVLDALGVRAAVETASPAELASVLAMIDAFVRQASDLLSDPVRAPGWSYTDMSVLQSQGEASAAVPAVLAAVADALPGLAERLESRAGTFLDVGVGVAGLAIAMCEHWPGLRAVGIDPWEPALSIARHNVAAAGLADRIELRSQRAEDLEDADAFDLAWVPGPFLPPSALPGAVERVAASLRPGGWIVLVMYRGDGELGMAVATLRAIRSGGSALPPADAERLLGEAGLADVATLPESTWRAGLLTVGRRPGQARPVP
jgi:SAM-dependent methyltransferase